MRGYLLLIVLALAAGAEEIPRGKIIDNVKIAADPSQSYALYVPSNYTPDHPWSLLIAFDPGARGLRPVERYQAGAEAYGYIVAGSNVSSNRSWQRSLESIQALLKDIDDRFPINEKRVYAGGLSGGAMVAMEVALSTSLIAGVIASSAGFPDYSIRKSAPFPIFGTGGTEDFNFIEMKRIDRALTTPHRVVIFDGGHTWPSSELATEALGWMEIQAMKSGRSPRNDALIEKIFASRLTQADAITNEKDQYVALTEILRDFEGLKDLSKVAAREAEMRKRKAVKDGLKKELADDQKEEQLVREYRDTEQTLGDPSTRAESLSFLKKQLESISKKANVPTDSSDRQLARRVLRAYVMGTQGQVRDQEYRKLLEKYRPAGGRGFQAP